MNNPVNEIIQMMRQGYSPQQLVMSYLQSDFGQTPMGKNILGLINSKDSAAIEQIARNLVAQRGLDYDTEFNAFKQQLGL